MGKNPYIGKSESKGRMSTVAERVYKEGWATQRAGHQVKWIARIILIDVKPPFGRVTSAIILH